MMSFKSIGAGKDASASAEYYENLASEDYYNEGGEPPGKWIGEHAKALGMDGEQVAKGELAAALKGFHPRTGEVLAKNAGEGHKGGYDFVFSAPKSVSTVWAVADKDTQRAISEAQQRSVEAAIKYAEQNAFHTRAGHAGEHHIQHQSGILAATYEHSTSREGDPQLHTHTVIANITESGKRLDFDSQWKMAIGAYYRQELTNELQKMGYTVERDGKSFEIKGVPKALQEELSTRRQQIKEKLAEKGLTGNAKAASFAALDTRIAKGEVNREQMVNESRELAKTYGLTAETIKELQSETVEGLHFDADKFAKDLTQNASTITEMQLQAQYFQAAQGVVFTREETQETLNKIKQENLVELVDPESGETRWTTEEMLSIEKSVAELSEKMQQDLTHGVSQENLLSAINNKPSLSDDQKNALNHITGPEHIAVVQGVAGAGKSYMLDAARDAWQKEGYDVRGVALSGKAAEGLQESAGIKSNTVHGEILEHSMQLEKGIEIYNSKTVMVMDEAGMTGSRLMYDLQSKVEAAGGKMVLVGDTRQLQPVDAGGSMRAIQNKIGSAKMDEIRRQKDPVQRDIVQDLAEGRAAQAIEKLEKLDQVKIYETANDTNKAISKAVVADMHEGKSTIAMAGTNAEVKALNKEIRNAAKEAGFVRGEEKTFQAERGARQFSEGDRVIFLKNDRSIGVKNGTTGTVQKAEDGKLQVKTDNGKNIEVDQNKYNKVDYGYSYTVHKSQSVTVDRAHYKPGQMNDRELSYVAGSRHRQTINIHTTKEGLQEFKDSAAKSHQKDTSADYQVKSDQKIKFTAADHGVNLNKAQERATSHERNHGNTNTSKTPSFDRAKHNIQRDAALAQSALNTKGKMPEGKELQKDIERGNAKWTRDSAGEKYLHYQDGRTYTPSYHSGGRETQLLQAKTLGLTEKRAVIVDKHLVDFKVAGRHIQAVKTGTTVLISRDNLKGKVAGALKDKMQAAREAKAYKEPNQRTLGDKAKFEVEKKLNQNEGWRRATTQEAIRARVSIAAGNKINKMVAKSELQKKVDAAKAPKGKTIQAENHKSDFKAKVEQIKQKIEKAKQSMKNVLKPEKQVEAVEKSTEKPKDTSKLQVKVNVAKTQKATENTKSVANKSPLQEKIEAAKLQKYTENAKPKEAEKQASTANKELDR